MALIVASVPNSVMELHGVEMQDVPWMALYLFPVLSGCKLDSVVIN